MKRVSVAKSPMLATALLALGMLASAPILAGHAADALPYLYEQMTKPAYKAPLEALLRGRSGLPRWVGVFIKTLNGVANPGTSLTIEGKPFELYTVCEPHNCGGNFLYALYAQGGGQAWALVTKDGKAVAMLGNPDAAQQKALTTAINE